jgi:glucan phosphoethanolaminetransferase (alkaline phosphatase superfamily)
MRFMKKVLLSISQYFSRFLAIISISALLLLYVMFKVPVVFWLGSMAGKNFTNNFGGIMIEFLKNDYLMFFLYPVLPIIAVFLLLAVFIWIFYRKEKEISRIGLKNLIISLIAIFVLVYLPIKATNFSFRINEKRAEEIGKINSTGEVYINKGFDKEFLKLYQTLADEGIQVWRKDPIAVVKNELGKGDLTYLSHGENKLTLKTIDAYEASGNSRAVVILENARFQAEIQLSQYWESADGIWLVRSYKILADN